MKKFETPVIDVIRYEAVDVIAVSIDHDNGFFDIDDLLNALGLK